MQHYILIDFENIQPKNLEVLRDHPFKVLVFVGANQAKIPLGLAAAMQVLGKNAEYIQISGNGKNALDFHIAFYIGELAAKHPEAHFYIISKDTGFDPLVKHMQARDMKVQREKDLAEIPILRISTTTSSTDKITAIVANLASRGQSRPRKVKTLSNTINALFTEQLAEKDLLQLVEELRKRKFIAINKGNVSYTLPDSPRPANRS